MKGWGGIIWERTSGGGGEGAKNWASCHALGDWVSKGEVFGEREKRVDCFLGKKRDTFQ